MSLFDEIKKALQEAVEEATGVPRQQETKRQAPRPKSPQGQKAPQEVPAPPAAAKKPRPQASSQAPTPTTRGGGETPNPSHDIRQELEDKSRIKRAILLNEILSPPLSRRRRQGGTI